MSRKSYVRQAFTKDFNIDNNLSQNDNIISTQITSNRKLSTPFLDSNSNNLERNLNKNKNKIKENLIETQSKFLIEKGKEKENIRKDARGNPIQKGNKKYKVTFKDLISKENLVNTIDIKKYKISQYSDLNKNDNVTCSCTIF